MYSVFNLYNTVLNIKFILCSLSSPTFCLNLYIELHFNSKSVLLNLIWNKRYKACTLHATQ